MLHEIVGGRSTSGNCDEAKPFHPMLKKLNLFPTKSSYSGKMFNAVLFLLVLLVMTCTSVSAATNRLGWTNAQANRWNKMKSQNHPYWQRLKKAADNRNVYADNGMRDGLVYLITGDAKYANSAFGHVSHYAGRSSGGAQPDRNATRHNFGEMALLYSWVADALKPADKARFRDILEHWSDLVFSSSHGTRTVDSDELVGHYFGIAMFAIAIRNEDRARSDALLNKKPGAFVPVGGLDATGVNRNTWRNTIADYVRLAAGGAWIESSQYNISTVRYLVEYSRMINAYFGRDKFPEVTALIPDIEQTLLQEMTPNLRDSFQWGDVQDNHKLTTYHRASLLALIADFTKNPNTYDLFDAVYQSWPTYSSLNPHFYLFLDPYVNRSPMQGWSSHNASGRGLAYHHSGWNNNDSFFGSWHQTPASVDHASVTAGNFGLFKNNEWVIGSPIGYVIASGFKNTLLVSGGVDTANEAKGQIAYDSGKEFLYHVGSTGGQTLRSGYFDPAPELIHEWTRSHLYLHNADGSDTIVVFDRLNASNPLTDLTAHQRSRIPVSPANPTRINMKDITDAGGKHQWIIHLDDPNPQIKGNKITWNTNKGQKVHLTSFLSSNYSTAVYDENRLHNGGPPNLYGNINPGELSYQLRLVPNQTSGWQTMMNVLHVGGALNGTKYLTAVSGEKARGVLVPNGVESSLIVFNGDSGSLPYRANGNPVAIAPTPNRNGNAAHDPARLHHMSKLRLFRTGFGLNVTTATRTTVYLADLDPGRKWVVSLNGANQNLRVSSAGLASFDIASGGTRSIKVFSSGNSGLASTPIKIAATPGTNSGITSGSGSTSRSSSSSGSGGTSGSASSSGSGITSSEEDSSSGQNSNSEIQTETERVTETGFSSESATKENFGRTNSENTSNIEVKLNPVSAKGIKRTIPVSGEVIKQGYLSIRLIFKGPTNFKWGKGLYLKIKDLNTGRIIYQVDPEPGHPQEGKWSLLLNTRKWVKRGHTYAVYIPKNFTRLSRSPWTVDPINWGVWKIHVN